MLEEIDECVLAGESFAFETTLSGLSYLRKIKQWKQLGYEVNLWFLSLPSADVAVSRVEVRVSQGGDDIPEHVIRRRFKAGLHNFHNLYSKAVDSWVVYDSYVQPPKVLDAPVRQGALPRAAGPRPRVHPPACAASQALQNAAGSPCGEERILRPP